MNQFGTNFRLAVWGESHGPQIGVTIDGISPGIPLSEADFAEDLARRRSGAPGTTPRREADAPQIVSGVYEGYTTGAPLTVEFTNADTRSQDYAALKTHYRPSHADLTAVRKFGGFNDPRGGGHFSGRITLGLVTAAAKDSVGGIVECRAEGVMPAVGEPFFDSTESLIAHLLFSVPAVKGVEFGSGFAAARMRGSEHNDPIVDASGLTATNHAGGIVGGLTNGNPLVVRAAVKPTASIAREQMTYNLATDRMEPLEIRGRHDVCIALRAAVVVEAAVAIALEDLLLRCRA